MTPDRLAREVAGIIGDGCRAVLLYGSLAAGGFRPGVSDIDLLAVTDGPLTEAQAAALVALVREADLGDAAGLDLHVVTTEVARSPSPAPPLELFVGRGKAGFDMERRLAAAPDLPAELSMAHQDNRPLVGAIELAQIRPEWVIARGAHWLRVWQGRTDDTVEAAFMVLTACRIWRFAVERVHVPKAEAGRWALAQDPSLTAISHALQPDGVIDEPGIAAVLAEALRHVVHPAG